MSNLHMLTLARLCRELHPHVFHWVRFFPKTPFFTDVMLGLVNICLNLSHRAVPNPSHPSWSNVVNKTFGGLEDEDLQNSYNFFLQALPEFESPGTDGEKGAKSICLNRNTSTHGLKVQFFSKYSLKL
jgi:hypothetical protein